MPASESIASTARPVVLFDGQCNFCDGTVRWILRRDTRKHFRFAWLQSDYGRSTLKRLGMEQEPLGTLILLEGDQACLRSTAALRILRSLPGPWPWLYPLIVIPRPIRDAVYRFIARHRYRWFGRKETCAWPSDEVKDRFIG